MAQRAKQRGAVRKINRDMLCLYKQHADEEERRLKLEVPLHLNFL